MAEKLPCIHFYPGDWLKDQVSGCSLAAQGLWLRMMMLMHDAERYGYLSLNGSPIPSQVLARRTGCDSLEQYDALLVELDSVGVPSRTRDRVIYSRRMVRDAKIRELQRIEWREQKRQSKSKKQLSPTPSIASSAAVPGGIPPPFSLSSSTSISTSLSKHEKSASTRPKNRTNGLRQFAPEDAWIEHFLKNQKYVAFYESELEALLDPDWWERVSVICNGVNPDFLEREFAKMGNWFLRNPKKRPTRMRLQNWLERAGIPQ